MMYPLTLDKNIKMSLNTLEKNQWIFRVFKEFYMHNSCDKYQLDVLLKMLKQDLEFFRYNKLLVALAELCNSISLCNMPILNQRLHRYRIYREEMRRISQTLSSENVKFLFVKTLTVFPKDIADLDILVYTTNDLLEAEKVLKKMGYVKRRTSQEQHLWSTYRDNVIVDIELHTSIAAAQYEYYPKSLLFKNAIEIDSIKTTSPLDGILLDVAHSIIKDLYLTLADLINFSLTLNKYKVDIEKLIHLAKDLGLFTPLLLIIDLTKIYDAETYEKFKDLIHYNWWRKIFIATDYLRMPLRPSINTIALSYIEMSIKKMRRTPLTSVMRELMSLPRGKGIDSFVRYVIRAKPLVKKFSE